MFSRQHLVPSWSVPKVGCLTMTRAAHQCRLPRQVWLSRRTRDDVTQTRWGQLEMKGTGNGWSMNRIVGKRMGKARVRVSLVVAGVTVLVGAAAAAAFETDTVSSYWRGLWWTVSLITTVGFIGEPPRTPVGAALSVVLMLGGFLLLAFVSAALASLFVREDETPVELQDDLADQKLLASLTAVEDRLERIERRLGFASRTDPDGDPAASPI